MASKKQKAAPTDDELAKLMEGLGEDDVPAAPAPQGTASTNATASQTEQDLLAELENLGADKATISRPHTPRLPSSATLGVKGSPAKRATSNTPPPGSGRSSEDNKPALPRKSGESTRSFHTSFTPSATSSDFQDAERRDPIAQPSEEAAPAATAVAGGTWWGSVFATASAAVKTAEAAVKEIQQNEEAKRWAEQVKGNVGVLRGFGE